MSDWLHNAIKHVVACRLILQQNIIGMCDTSHLVSQTSGITKLRAILQME